MRPITFLVPDLGYRSHARQVSLLAPALQAQGNSVVVYSLDGDGPLAKPLREAGVAVEGRGGRRLLHLHALWQLRQRLATTEEMHVRGFEALSSLHYASLGMPLPRLFLWLNGRERIGELDRWLSRRADRILVPHQAAWSRLSERGLSRRAMTIVPPAVAPALSAIDRGEFCRTHGIPLDAELFLCAGRMLNRDDLFWAVWAFEFLRYAMPRIHLLVVGDGPGQLITEAGARGLAPEGSRVHFLGARPDLLNLLSIVDLVIAPQPGGGVNVALEAMAAGRAVVAVESPDFAAIIRHGETGILTPIRNAREMARSIRRLLEDRPHGQRIGMTAQREVEAMHKVSNVIAIMSGKS